MKIPVPPGAKVAGLAIAWFRREDWPAWRAIDPGIQPDYDQWLARIERLKGELAMGGQVGEPVIIEPEEFQAWRAANPVPVAASHQRASFAAFKLAERGGL